MEAIEDHFAHESLTNKVFLKQSLFYFQQHDTLSCLDLTSQIMEMSNQLALMNFQIQPLNLVIIIYWPIYTHGMMFVLSKLKS